MSNDFKSKADLKAEAEKESARDRLRAQLAEAKTWNQENPDCKVYIRCLEDAIKLTYKK